MTQHDDERRRKSDELQSLRRRVEQLEHELAASAGPPPGGFPGYYASYYATTGFLLGLFGACTSLLFNVVGSLLVTPEGGPHPLRLIQVYLTFPFGEKALHMESGLVLALGCCLYIGTGMLLGIPFHLFLTRYAPHAALGKRAAIASAMSLALWVVNFYVVLSWLQPLLFGGRWIVELIPPWVAALTHLVFGWTMALVYPWGVYVPYKIEGE